MGRNAIGVIRASLKSILLLAALLFIGGGCQQEEQAQTILEKALSSDDPAIARVMANPEKYELQIRLSQTIKAGEQVRFEDIDYQVDDSVYFYPASTVKFAVAVAALEKLNQQDVDIHQRYYIEGDSLEASFADDIRAVFAISDNHANNRLFEYVGQDGINAQLRERGVSPIRIAHRLSTALADTLITRPLLLLGQNEESTATRAIENSPIEALKLKGMTKGIGFMNGSEKIDEAFDFSRKNYFPISAQNALLKRVIFPEAFEEKDRLQISESQREYLLHTMSKLPREQGYDPEEFYDGYVKFFLFGDSEDVIPTDFKIYNKVGYAYGTLTDTAYIVNQKEGVAFLLHATILVNKDGVFNDDQYEYDEIGIPFLAALGRELYRLQKEEGNK
jgi:hypothetical protein